MSFPRYPRKKFWIGKPIARVVKKKTGEFSDKVQSLQRGLREFQGEGQVGVRLGGVSGAGLHIVVGGRGPPWEVIGVGIRSQAGRALGWELGVGLGIGVRSQEPGRGVPWGGGLGAGLGIGVGVRIL